MHHMWAVINNVLKLIVRPSLLTLIVFTFYLGMIFPKDYIPTPFEQNRSGETKAHLTNGDEKEIDQFPEKEREREQLCLQGKDADRLPRRFRRRRFISPPLMGKINVSKVAFVPCICFRSWDKVYAQFLFLAYWIPHSGRWCAIHTT